MDPESSNDLILSCREALTSDYEVLKSTANSLIRCLNYILNQFETPFTLLNNDSSKLFFTNFKPFHDDVKKYTEYMSRTIKYLESIKPSSLLYLGDISAHSSLLDGTGTCTNNSSHRFHPFSSSKNALPNNTHKSKIKTCQALIPKTYSFQSSNDFSLINLPTTTMAIDFPIADDDFTLIDPYDYHPPMNEEIKSAATDVSVSYVFSPNDFYAHLTNDINDFIYKVHKLQTKLYENGIRELPEIKEGMFCMAKYSQDYYWYRCRVMSTVKKNGIARYAKVFFYDFGNIEDVLFNNLMPMSRLIADIPIQAINCEIDCLPLTGKEWPEECIEFFKSITLPCSFKACFSKPVSCRTERGNWLKYLVDLFTDDSEENVTLQMVKFLRKEF